MLFQTNRFPLGEELESQLNVKMKQDSELQCRPDWAECTENRQCCSKHCVYNGVYMCMTVTAEKNSDVGETDKK